MDKEFEIGLVGAGAISAGAYSSGVFDFLVQALDCWYDVRGKQAGVPGHGVRLTVFSGASAGGIVAALGASYLGTDQPPVTTPEDAARNEGRNKLFDSWVERIDISSLLQTEDLDSNPKARVVSLLDSSVLVRIADKGLVAPPRAVRRAYVAENFEVFLTLTNLRGVPYSFRLEGGHVQTRYSMSLHADYAHFNISEAPPQASPAREDLSWSDFSPAGGVGSTALQSLKLAALATSAFPIGLAPRGLKRALPGGDGPNWYSFRIEYAPGQFVAPDWGGLQQPYDYAFQCVDGGVINNEPFELARKVLLAREIARRAQDGPPAALTNNPRPGNEASRAVLLIDPFPSVPVFPGDEAQPADLLKLALGLVSALKNQARFKPEELRLAASEDVYSRFMIAPSRGGEEFAIACGSLGGFGGFLKRSFREHDYFLGRRNAQKFLRDHFVLYENNPLFDPEWVRQHADTWCVRDKDTKQPVLRDGQRLLPIIPLVGAASADCYDPAWPKYLPEDLKALSGQMEKRAKVVLRQLTSQYFEINFAPVRWIANWVIGRKRNDVVEWAVAKVKAELRAMKLMQP